MTIYRLQKDTLGRFDARPIISALQNTEKRTFTETVRYTLCQY